MDTLTDEVKTCLLRAARRELNILQAEAYRLAQLNSRYAAGPIAANAAEIECLSAGISWLWNHKGGGP